MLLVFGSLNVDLVFQMEVLPRPGETVLCPGYARVAGGKGANQAAAAVKAGAAVRMIGQVGDDDHGRFARHALEETGVDCAGVRVCSGRPTGIAMIAVGGEGENQIIVGSGANLETHAGQIEDDALSAGTTVLCQNEIRSEETFAMIERARARGARSILNLAPAPAAVVPAKVLDALDVLVVNEIEAAAAAGAGRNGDPATLARDLAKQHDLTCVVTLGREGALAFGPDCGYRVRALSITAIDTTGAGDAFVGVLAAGLDQDMPMPNALCRASVAAGLACLQIGAQSGQPTSSAIEAGLSGLAEAAPFA